MPFDITSARPLTKKEGLTERIGKSKRELLMRDKERIGATGEWEKKPLYRQVPLEENKALATIQDIAGQFGTEFVNQALLGAPKVALRGAGAEVPSPITAGGKIARVAGGIGGAVAGAPGRIGVAAFKALPRAPMAIRAGISGAAIGAAETPPGGILDIRQRVKQAALAGGMGVAGGILFNIGKTVTRNIKNVVNPTKLARKVRSAFFGAKRKYGKAVEKAIDIIPEDRITDISDEIGTMKSAIENVKENPGLASDINSIIRTSKNPLLVNNLKAMLKDPNLARDLTAREVQSIKRAIQSSPRIARKLAQGKFANWTQGEFELLDLLDDVRAKQIQSYPELTEPFADYHKVVNNFNIVKNKIKVGRLLTNIKRNWDDPEVKEVVEQLLPRDMITQMDGYKNSIKFLKALGYIGGTVIGYGALRYITGTAVREALPESGAER